MNRSGIGDCSGFREYGTESEKERPEPYLAELGPPTTVNITTASSRLHNRAGSHEARSDSERLFGDQSLIFGEWFSRSGTYRPLCEALKQLCRENLVALKFALYQLF